MSGAWTVRAGRASTEWELTIRNVQRGFARAVDESDGTAADAADRMRRYFNALGPQGRLVAMHLLLEDSATLRTERAWRPVVHPHPEREAVS